jgi:hypothetical protein
MRKEDTMHAEQEFVHEELVPLVLIAAEVGEPVELVAHRFGDDVQLDDVGMRVVSAAVARRFFTALAEQEARMQEQDRISQERASRDASLVGGGVPALSDDASPLESLLAGDRSYSSPAEEFGQWAKPNFLVEELEAGQRRQAAEREAIRRRKGKAE